MGSATSFGITGCNSAVGILRRFASSWVMLVTDFVLFFTGFFAAIVPSPVLGALLAQILRRNPTLFE